MNRKCENCELEYFGKECPHCSGYFQNKPSTKPKGYGGQKSGGGGKGNDSK